MRWYFRLFDRKKVKRKVKKEKENSYFIKWLKCSQLMKIYLKFFSIQRHFHIILLQLKKKLNKIIL